MWTPAHYILGVLGAVLAAVAGVAGLTAMLGKTEAGWIAIASAAASSIAVFLKSDEKRREHAGLARAWDDLRDTITLLYEARPGGADAQLSPGATKPPVWTGVTDALSARASEIRAGKVDTKTPLPQWRNQR
jgi:hypothetical protein